ncbi:flavin-containing monooxygenase [Halovulum sp. GXIMD14794]
MQHHDVIVIGAGQAGLAMSRCLTERGIDHLVLDRGAVGERWRSERWASLRLLTPNWMTRLPGHAYTGNDPDGFMHKDAVVAMLSRYARGFDAPVQEYKQVHSVTHDGARYRIQTGDQLLSAHAVVLATGACDRPHVPGWAARLPRSLNQITTTDYVSPDQLDEGGVLVVGASATGVQLAEEIRISGRQVTLAVGSHVWLPRRYRGRDIMHWMDRAGLLAERRDPSVPAKRALRQPSLQLVGSQPARDVRLDTLDRQGVRCVGRVLDADGDRLSLAPTLRAEIAAARTRTERVLDRINEHVGSRGADSTAGTRPTLDRLPESPSELHLGREGIRTVLWATGFRRSYDWLHLPVLGADGELIHTGGVTGMPGLYALGLPFMRRRNSTFIDGVGADARDLIQLIARQLGLRPQAAA